ncbi:hypothetical protein HPB47_009371, partial [Ixodes persulcatus]
PAAFEAGEREAATPLPPPRRRQFTDARARQGFLCIVETRRTPRFRLVNNRIGTTTVGWALSGAPADGLSAWRSSGAGTKGSPCERASREPV